MPTFAEKLKNIRKWERYTLAEFSDKCGIPKGTLGGYENEGRKIGLDNLSKILKVPEFKKYALYLTVDDSPEAIEKVEQEVLEKYKRKLLENDELTDTISQLDETNYAVLTQRAKIMLANQELKKLEDT